MDPYLSVDGYGGLGGLDYLFSGLGSLFGDYSYGYDDYSYYDDYDLSLSVGGLGGLFDGLFDDLSYLFGDYGYDYNDDYYYSYDNYGINGDVGGVIQVGADIMDGLDDEIDVDGLISGLLGGEGDLSGLSDILAGLLGGDNALTVDGELGDLSGLSDLLAGLLGGDTTLSVDGELGDLSGLSDILAGLLGGDTTLTIDGELGDLSGLSDLLAGLLGGDTTLTIDSELGDLSGLSDILAGLLGGDTTLTIDSELGGLSGLSDPLAGLLGGDTTLSVDGTSDLLSGLLGGSGLDLSSLLSGLLGGDTALSVDGELGGSGLDLSSLLSGLLGGTTLTVDGGTASTSGLDLSSLSSLLGGLTGGTTSTSGLDLSSLLSSLLGGGTTISVDGTTASTSSTSILSVLGNLGNLGNLFSGLTSIMSGIGSGDLDGFDLLDSLTNLYNGTGISVDGSAGSADLLSGLSGLLGGNGLSSLLSGLLGGGTASTSGLDLSALSSLLGGLSGGTASVSTTNPDTTSTNSSYNIIGLVNLISEYAALNGGQDVSSSTGTIIQISDDTWNMMQTMSVLSSILPGEDIYVNSNGKQGIVLSSDIDSLQVALKPYNDYITVDDLAVGLAITINDYAGIQKTIALAKEDDSVVSGADPGTLITPATSSDVATSYPVLHASYEIPYDSIRPYADANVEDFPALLIPVGEETFQVELDSLREVGFWLDDASMDMGAQNWDGWDIRAIGDFQGDGVDDLLLSHSQTGIMVLLGDGDLSKWDSLDQFVTDDPVSAGAIPADAAGLRMVGDASQWLESGGASANWIILA